MCVCDKALFCYVLLQSLTQCHILPHTANPSLTYSHTKTHRQALTRYTDILVLYSYLLNHSFTHTHINSLCSDTLAQASSVHKPIHSNNIGFKLLKRLGWNEDKGLGKLGQGRTEPVLVEVKADTMGLGKAEKVLEMTNPENFKRRQMEVEIELTEERKQKQFLSLSLSLSLSLFVHVCVSVCMYSASSGGCENYSIVSRTRSFWFIDSLTYIRTQCFQSLNTLWGIGWPLLWMYVCSCCVCVCVCILFDFHDQERPVFSVYMHHPFFWRFHLHTDRQEIVEKQTAIREDVREMNNVFLCELCNKQYTNIKQYENHLSSYDHHHKKVLLTSIYVYPCTPIAIPPISSRTKHCCWSRDFVVSLCYLSVCVCD